MNNKIRKAYTINQSNDCRCNGCNRKQQSRYNKSAKRNSSRLGRRLDEIVIEEYMLDS